jgi:hypothetical protein
MLMDPFETTGGFDTDGFLSSTLLSVQSMENTVPLGRDEWAGYDGSLTADGQVQKTPSFLCSSSLSTIH